MGSFNPFNEDAYVGGTSTEKGAKSFGIRNSNRPPTGAVDYDFPDIFAVPPEEYFQATMTKFPQVRIFILFWMYREERKILTIINLFFFFSFPFSQDGIADVQQARCLYSVEGGYQFLDVRSTPELDDGKIPGAIHIPLVEAKKRWDSEAQGTVMIQTVNPDFINEVHKKLPDKSQGILIACSDSRDRAIQVLELLDNEGYTGIVGLQGGANTWLNTFDNKLGRRRKDGYTEVANSDGTTGIFGTRPGAGWQVEGGLFSQGGLGADATEWKDWAAETGYNWDAPSSGGAAPAAGGYGAEPAAGGYGAAPAAGGYGAEPAAAPAAAPSQGSDSYYSW